MISFPIIALLAGVCFFAASPPALPATAQEDPPVRPQEPRPPYPYRSENVTFENKAAGVTLAGTLTMPATGAGFTAVVMVTGSGPQNRDEEVAGHKPFLVIADHLTRNGIAVLRYDDRGVGESTGDFASAVITDFAYDARCAVAYLKSRPEIDPARIGILGHSEGGTTAPLIAAQTGDVAFIVSLAGVGMSGTGSTLLQQETMWRASGVPEEIIAKLVGAVSKTYEKIDETGEYLSESEIVSFLTEMKDEISAELEGTGMSADDYIAQFAPQLADAATQYRLRFNAAPYFERVECPVFAANGSKDLQVISTENLSAIRRSMERGGNKNYVIKEYPNLNHLFQECTTGFFDEYSTIEQTVSPQVLEDITQWISAL